MGLSETRSPGDLHRGSSPPRPTTSPSASSSSWLQVLSQGAAAGLLGGLAMVWLFAVLRDVSGVATPPEMIGDRLTALISIEQFFALLDRFGGYNGLKQAGGGGAVAGMLAAGVLGGVLLAWQERNGRRGRRALAGFVTVLWLLTVALLFPVLRANYLGLPPAAAMAATAAGLLVSYSAYGLVTYVAHSVLASGGAPRPYDPRRRAALVGLATVVTAAAAWSSVRRLADRATFPYDGLEYRGADLDPITPNERFYTVTKNIVDPNPSAVVWRLEIGGLVERPRTYAFDEIRALPSTRQETTLMCISNGVGGGLMSNAIWTGLPLRTLIEAAGPRPGVVEVVLYGADGYTDTFPLDKALEPTTFVTYEMNGEPLPQQHGYPVRVLVPGLFGEKSVKWVTRVELVDQPVKGFYAQQGWGPSFVIPTRSHFLYGDFRASLAGSGGTIVLQGIAFAGTRDVALVEVSTDDGRTWQAAQFWYDSQPIAWKFWRFDWRPEVPGEYRCVVRASDGTGALQTAESRGTVPEGATGYHAITVFVDA